MVGDAADVRGKVGAERCSLDIGGVGGEFFWEDNFRSGGAIGRSLKVSSSSSLGNRDSGRALATRTEEGQGFTGAEGAAGFAVEVAVTASEADEEHAVSL